MRMKNGAKLAGVGLLGAAVVINEHEHIDIEIYQPIAPMGQLVYIASSTSSLTTGGAYHGAVVLSPVFK